MYIYITQPINLGVGNTDSHPLRHTAMVLIDMVAKIQDGRIEGPSDHVIEGELNNIRCHFDIYMYADIMENYNTQKYTASLEALADRRDGIL